MPTLRSAVRMLLFLGAIGILIGGIDLYLHVPPWWERLSERVPRDEALEVGRSGSERWLDEHPTATAALAALGCGAALWVSIGGFVQEVRGMRARP